MNPKLGFMQGRLTPMNNGIIQEFPKANWEREFVEASQVGIRLLEWTIDRDQIFENPLMTKQGREKILELKNRTNIRIESLTADCCMQVPFWKLKSAADRSAEIEIFRTLIECCSEVGIRTIVLPLVDNGSIQNKENKKILKSTFEELTELLQNKNIKIACETDMGPDEVNGLLNYFSSSEVGINYDLGNSAALGFCAYDEWEAYGKHIINIHIKDRLRGGSTVRLGHGDVNFPMVRECYNDHGYEGNWILQTARSDTEADLSELMINYNFSQSNLL